MHDDHVGNASYSRLFTLVEFFGVLLFQLSLRVGSSLLGFLEQRKITLNVIDLGLNGSLSSNLAQLLLICDNLFALDLGLELLDLFKLLDLVSDLLLHFSLEWTQQIKSSIAWCAICGDFVGFHLLGSAITHFQNSFFF